MNSKSQKTPACNCSAARSRVYFLGSGLYSTRSNICHVRAGQMKLANICIILHRIQEKSCQIFKEKLLSLLKSEVERALVALPDFKSGAPG